MNKKTINLDTKSYNSTVKSRKNFYSKNENKTEKRYTPHRSKKNINLKMNIDLDNQPSNIIQNKSNKSKEKEYIKKNANTSFPENNPVKTNDQPIKIKKIVEKSPINNLNNSKQNISITDAKREKTKSYNPKDCQSINMSVSNLIKKEEKSKEGRYCKKSQNYKDTIPIPDNDKKSKDEYTKQQLKKSHTPKQKGTNFLINEEQKSMKKKKSLKTKIYSKKKITG